ncbi:metallophosphoesterase [Bradyrhizobium sp. RDM12]
MSVIRMHVASDFHHDHAGNRITKRPYVQADVIVVPGDAMEPGSHALRLVRWMYPDLSIPVIYVPGNHDFYSESNPKQVRLDPTTRTTWEAERATMREVAAELGILYGDDDVIPLEINDEPLRFICSTGWSSFAARPPYMMFGEAVMEAKKWMRDYRAIKVGRGRSKDRLTPGMTIDAHKKSVAFIEQTLAEPFDGETVVVTHMCPSYRSLAKWDPEKPREFQHLDWCYASDLEKLMRGDSAPAIWCHGHVHENRDYVCGDTRVVSNPRGYPDPRGPGGRENPHFDPLFVVELEPKPKLEWKP